MNDNTPKGNESTEPRQPGATQPNAEASAGEARPATENEGEPSGELDFPVVGVGASAGGLEAMEQLLQHLPSDPGVAVVFVQHLSPEHASSLSDILPRSTKMPVREAEDGMRVERDHVYIIPPNRDLAVMHGTLHLMARPEARARHMPINYLFRSLARDQQSRAIGVVLSGTGSDGSEGLRAIKAEGGVTLAQDEDSARYAGMPRAAAATGQVDLVLPPDDLGRELARIAHHPHVSRPPAGREEESSLGAPEALQKIFILLRQVTDVDFSQYKQSTVERRISRRMVLHRLESPQQYLKLLQRTPREVHALFDDMLISVTSFFREPEAFEALKKQVFPKIVEEKGPDAPIRIWVPACSTGEEPYSIAIALLEYLAEYELHLPVQIFATDISEGSIEKARRGQYSENIAGDMSAERLRRHFVHAGDGYQVSKTVRDLCVFARQNVTKDPPFSNIDLISCRNLLIYLGRALQQRVLPTFHYALRPSGFLLLGQSETIGGFADLFSLIDREHKIYVRKGTASRLPPELGPPSTAAQSRPEAKPRPMRPSAEGAERQADRLLLERYAPPGVIIDSDMQILHFRGQTGRFLEPSPGAASLNLLRMARPGLALDLQSVIHEARKSRAPAQKEGLSVQIDGGSVTVNVRVYPLGNTDDARFLVLFEEVPPPAHDEGKAPRSKAAEDDEERAGTGNDESEADRLRRELQQTKATMQSMLEDHETTNEELRAANEEIQSANEELQSTNEELETAKEELQSTNEELSTLNAELENQNAEANRAIDDFNNLHRAVDIPVILLDKELRIRRFTPPAERQLGLQPSDQGRRIGQLRLGLRLDDLESKISQVLQSLNTFRDEVRSEQDRWYSMQIRPFRTQDDRITGAVLTLVDVTDIRRAEHANYARVLAEGIVDAVREPLLVLDEQLCVVTANRAFYRTFQTSAGKTEGCVVYELGQGQWDHDDLRRLLEDIVPEDTAFDGFEIVHEFPGLGRKRAVLDARRIEPEGGLPNLILLTVRELTDA